MIVPQYWAECRLQSRRSGKQITVRRWGWSDLSQEDAQRMADERAAEAETRLWSGEALTRRESKMTYGEPDGVPIREEILSRHGQMVITRNSYGARCLNSPDVLFADIDFPELRHSCSGTLLIGLLFLIASGVAEFVYDQRWLAVALFMGAIYFSGKISRWLHDRKVKKQPPPEDLARYHIHVFLQRHPHWNFRVYRTPAGMRLLATHQLFQPESEELSVAFTALSVDLAYAYLCRKQRCFRARLTGKPWRMGMRESLIPRLRVWPIPEKSKAEREQWMAQYDARAPGYAACRYVEDLGSGAVIEEVKETIAIHDEVSGAMLNLPLA